MGERMKRVILTVGPQGAGKSTYCEAVCRAHPEVVLISRDAILIELYGTVWLDSYSGGHLEGERIMWRRVRQQLKEPNLTLILDCWNGAADRPEMTATLRRFGADWIGVWQFMTPLETACEWFFARSPNDYSHLQPEHAARMHRLDRVYYCDAYTAFHRQSVSLEQGFDKIRQINPLDQLPPSLDD